MSTETANQVYILLCSDNTLYTGSTNDLHKRLHAHNHTKKGAKYIQGRRPAKLVYSEVFETLKQARQRELVIKKMTRQEKLKLISSDN